MQHEVVFYLFLNINQVDALNFIVSLFQASTCFRRAKIVLYSFWYHHIYRWPSRAQIERGLDDYRCDDTRDCIIQFLPS